MHTLLPGFDCMYIESQQSVPTARNMLPILQLAIIQLTDYHQNVTASGIYRGTHTKVLFPYCSRRSPAGVFYSLYRISETLKFLAIS